MRAPVVRKPLPKLSREGAKKPLPREAAIRGDPHVSFGNKANKAMVNRGHRVKSMTGTVCYG